MHAPAPVSEDHRALESTLEHVANQSNDLSGDLLARLVERLRPARRGDVASAPERIRELIALLDARPALAAGLSVHLKAVLLSRMHRTLYAESGILQSQGFLTGLWGRLLGRLLPPAVDADFLRDLVAEVFDEPHDAAWVALVPQSQWIALFERLGVYGPEFAAVRAHCRAEVLEAMRMTSHRLAALGMEPALLRYLPELARHESPFLAQSDEVRLFLAQHSQPGTAHDGHLEILLAQCTQLVARIRTRSHESGVGVSLVFILARIEQLVDRLRLLRQLAVPDAADAPERVQARGAEFFARLVQAENRRNRIADLFEGTVALLARRVTEHASKSGEHYVTDSRAEYRQMWRAASGAGLIVGVMALLKILASTLGLPAFWEAVAFSLVYGVGFVVVHVLHLTIATKQPAMTAATLAAALDASPDPEARLDTIAALAARVSRTQWVSIFGNVTIGFLTALFLGLVASVFLGLEPVTIPKADKLLHELHPWQSLALVHAGIAGVYLFLSGLISGYYDNQSLYHRIPERLRRVKWLRRAIGTERLDRFAGYVEHNLGALAGNFLFGCMLGSTGTIGAFFGLPIDIRHVSFAAANLAFGLQALEFSLPWQTITISAVGVILIGGVNLIVSFWLALRVALRSRGIGPDDTRGLTRRVLRRLRESPREFFLPPKSSPAAPPAPSAARGTR